MSSSAAAAAVNEWDNEYARLARIASQLRSTGGSVAEQQQLAVHVQRLQEHLEKLPAISPAEVQRRRRLLQHMQTTTSTTNVVVTSPQQQQQQQSVMAMAMRQQDSMIEELAVGVGRLRDQTQLIGEEARMHVNLLGDMEQNLDIAQHGLEAETRRAAQLKEDQSVWRLQLIVAGLSVLLVLLILLGLS